MTIFERKSERSGIALSKHSKMYFVQTLISTTAEPFVMVFETGSFKRFHIHLTIHFNSYVTPKGALQCTSGWDKPHVLPLGLSLQ